MMKHAGKMAGILMALTAWMLTPVAAQEPESAEKTLSPYFLVMSDDPALDQLPLKSTAADVRVAGVIADVRVTQVYQNEGKKTLEAVYVFPASTRASVYGMKMTIGERTIIAKVREREQARREYEQAKKEGKSASLLEQKRPNVFQMNVANILPGDVIQVELSYTELLVPTKGTYEFVYPTVVGPRYSNLPEATAPKSEEWVQNPYLQEGEAPTYGFDIHLSLSGSMPIQQVASSSHKVSVNYESPSLATVRLDPSEKSGGNRDFILKYRLAGGKIESGLLLYKGEKENFFLLMVQPPERVTAAHIPPREYVFIVDVSGSMRGFPLDISKQLLKDLIGNLRPTDKFNVLLFAGDSRTLSEQSLPATPENIGQAITFMEQQRGGGGTELLPALQHALGMKGTEGYSRLFVIVTDGYVRVEKAAFDLIRNNLGTANMFAFGIGSSVNRHLIEGMARVGMGEPLVITKPVEAPGKASAFREYIQSPVLTRAKADFGQFDVHDVEPPGIPDVLAERPVIIFGKWRGEAKGKIRLTGLTGDRKYEQTVDVGQSSPMEANAALPYLWARHKIALLSDYGQVQPGDESIKAEVTRLGLTYNLLTAYTSFVAIDSLIRAKDGKATTVRQPLPLPQGVPGSAVGGKMRMKGFAGGAPTSMSRSMPRPALESPAQPHLKRKAIIIAGGTEAMPPALPLKKKEPQKLADKEEKAEEGAAVMDEEASEKRRVKGRVRHVSEKMVITANLSEMALKNLIQQLIGKIEACYQHALQKNPALKGEIVLKITTDGAGQVTDAEITGFADEDLNACIREKVKGWRFPPSNDGKPGRVEYSLVFETLG